MMNVRIKSTDLGWLFFITAILLLGVSTAVWCAESDYNGNYFGEYTPTSGSDRGVWVGIIDSTGDNVFLSLSTVLDQGDAGYLFYDAFSDDGVSADFDTVGTAIQGSEVDANITRISGAVDGTWANPSGDAGVLSGGRLTSCGYEGSYSGTYSGEDSGTWTMTIAANAEITGSFTSADGTASFEGGCHPNGYVLAAGETVDFDFAFAGSISGSDISGSWITDDGESGTFSTGGSSGGGGGGGGCFILSLMGE